MKTYTPETIEKDVQKAKEAVSLAGAKVRTLQGLAEKGYDTDHELPQAVEDLKTAVFYYQHLLQVRLGIDMEWVKEKHNLTKPS